MNKTYIIADLIYRKMRDQQSLSDEEKLQNWLGEGQENETLYKQLMSSSYLLSKLELYEQFDAEQEWPQLEKALFPSTQQLSVWRNPRKLLRYAASVMLPLILLSSLVWYFLNPFGQDNIAQIDVVIQPGVERATLVLSDGTSVDLQAQTKNAPIAQGATQITQFNQTLTYTVADTLADQADEVLVFNELMTPKGGRYTVELPDGTKVWLNAATTLRYPVNFTDSIREVFLVGEAFFDVTHTGQPFVVNAEEIEVQVLGTMFDISSYPDDPSSVATLVEGSINLMTGKEVKLLKPDEQAVFTRANESLVVAEVNSLRYASWRDGKINFNNSDLDAVMRTLARWYDFEYSFENEKASDYHFTASIESTEKISDILQMLEMTTEVRFEFRNNTLVIL
ncbi:MAG: DUF4974 domain-containing protein [Reichenbachiella sp.]